MQDFVHPQHYFVQCQNLRGSRYLLVFTGELNHSRISDFVGATLTDFGETIHGMELCSFVGGLQLDAILLP